MECGLARQCQVCLQVAAREGVRLHPAWGRCQLFYKLGCVLYNLYIKQRESTKNDHKMICNALHSRYCKVQLYWIVAYRSDTLRSLIGYLRLSHANKVRTYDAQRLNLCLCRTHTSKMFIALNIYLLNRSRNLCKYALSPCLLCANVLAVSKKKKP